MGRLLDGLSQYFDDNGEMNAGGKLYFYETGSTTTLKDIYSDVGETVGITNPHTLDSEGRLQSAIFGSGAYNVRAYKVNADLSETLIDEADPIGDVGGSQLATWNSLTTYSIGDLAQGSNGSYYVSIANSNTGNDPTTDATKWTQVEFVKYWNTNEEYSANDMVRDANGFVYVSTQSSNTGNTPSTSPLYWACKNGPTTVNLSDDVDATNMGYYLEHNDITFTNTSGGAEYDLTLPAATSGLKFSCRVDAAQYIKNSANGTNTFSYGTAASAAGGYVRANTVGAFWRCECYVTGEWTITIITNTLKYDE